MMRDIKNSKGHRMPRLAVRLAPVAITSFILLAFAATASAKRHEKQPEAAPPAAGASMATGAPAASPMAAEPARRPDSPGAASAPRAAGGGMLQALDMNGDGHVSRDEYIVGQRVFARLDKDKDGVVKRADL